MFVFWIFNAHWSQNKFPKVKKLDYAKHFHTFLAKLVICLKDFWSLSKQVMFEALCRERKAAAAFSKWATRDLCWQLENTVGMSWIISPLLTRWTVTQNALCPEVSHRVSNSFRISQVQFSSKVKMHLHDLYNKANAKSNVQNFYWFLWHDMNP